eukprot:Gb_07925 [translate_table: standard]
MQIHIHKNTSVAQGGLNHFHQVVKLPQSANLLSSILACLGLQIHNNNSIAQGGTMPLSPSSQVASVGESAIFYPGLPCPPTASLGGLSVISYLGNGFHSSVIGSISRRIGSACPQPLALMATRPAFGQLANPLNLHGSSIRQHDGAVFSNAPSPATLELQGLQRLWPQRLLPPPTGDLQWLYGINALQRLFTSCASSSSAPPGQLWLPPNSALDTPIAAVALLRSGLSMPTVTLLWHCHTGSLVESPITNSQPHRLTSITCIATQASLVESHIANLTDCLSRRSVGNSHVTSTIAQGLTCLGMQIHIHKNTSVAQGKTQPLSPGSQAASVGESAIFYPGLPRTRPDLPWYANKITTLLAHTGQSSDCLTRWSIGNLIPWEWLPRLSHWLYIQANRLGMPSAPYIDGPFNFKFRLGVQTPQPQLSATSPLCSVLLSEALSTPLQAMRPAFGQLANPSTLHGSSIRQHDGAVFSNAPSPATRPTSSHYPTPTLSIAPQLGSITVLFFSWPPQLI